MMTDDLSDVLALGSHTGSIIGGVPPVAYSAQRIPGKHPSWLFSTSGSSDPAGKEYPAVEWYPAATAGPNAVALPRPIPQNTGKVSMSFPLWVSPEALTAGNVIETDLLIVTVCPDGIKREFNGSGQRHILSGEIDDGNWTDTGLDLGPLTPNVKHEIVWSYAFDLAEKTISVLSYSCDGAVSPIAEKFQNMPATESDWTEGAFVQLQMGSLPAGNPWSIRVGVPKLHWS